MENYIENPNKKNKADIKVKQNLFNSVADKLFIKVAHHAGIVILYAADVFCDYYLINNIEYLYNQLNTFLVESKQSPLLDISTLRNNAIKEAAKYVKPNNILDFFDKN
jgi:hypothetical protein